MKLLIVNFNPIFYPESEKELVHILRKYKAKYVRNTGGYVPEKILPYLFGWQEDDSYSYYYSYLGDRKKRFNLDTQALETSTITKNFINNGYYRVGTNFYGGLNFQDIEALELIEAPRVILNQPLHSEIVLVNNELVKSVKNINELSKDLKDFVTKYQDDKTKTDSLVTNMAVALRTIPAVVGSPIAPALVGVASNTTATSTNNIQASADDLDSYYDDLDKFINDINSIIKEK